MRATLANAHEPSSSVHAPLGALLPKARVASSQAAESKLTRPEPLLRELDLHGLLRLLEFGLLNGQELVALTLLQLFEYLYTLLCSQRLDVLVADLGHWVW